MTRAHSNNLKSAQHHQMVESSGPSIAVYRRERVERSLKRRFFGDADRELLKSVSLRSRLTRPINVTGDYGSSAICRPRLETLVFTVIPKSGTGAFQESLVLPEPVAECNNIAASSAPVP